MRGVEAVDEMRRGRSDCLIPQNPGGLAGFDPHTAAIVGIYRNRLPRQVGRNERKAGRADGLHKAALLESAVMNQGAIGERYGSKIAQIFPAIIGARWLFFDCLLDLLANEAKVSARHLFFGE